MLVQKEHDETVKALKMQLELETSSQKSGGGEALQSQLSQALDEVRLLKQQLQQRENSFQAITARYDAECASKGAGIPSDPNAGIATQSAMEERDRAVANLAAQAQAWNVEKEELKKRLEEMKSDFSAKIAAASKVTPGGPAATDAGSTLQKVDAALRECIKKGELRGAAVEQVGKVTLQLRLGSIFFECSQLSLAFPHVFCKILDQSLEYKNLAQKHPPPPESKSCSIM
jgi:hypothetical protein